MIGEFNTLCAVIYANLLHDKFNNLKQFAHMIMGLGREKMKADFMVVATALAYNANVIYSNDKEVISYSKGLIPANNLPKLPESTIGFVFRKIIVFILKLKNLIIKVIFIIEMTMSISWSF